MILFFIFVLGLSVGSFLNVIIDRLPNNKSLLGRSHCDFCKKTLKPSNLIPILSYFLQGGRCESCRKKLSAQYPTIEMVTGLSFVFTWFQFIHLGLAATILYLIVVSIFIAMFVADLKYQIIPDELQLLLFCVSFGLLYLLNNPNLLDYAERLVFAFVAMFPLLFLFLITKGKGMGFADVKLTFILGFLFGLKLGFLIIYLAFISGGIVGFYLLVTGLKKRKSKIAFGPFIILSAILVLYNQSFIIKLLTEFLR